MEKHNIDKLFSDKLAGHTPAFNPAHWSQMEGIIQDQGNSGSLLWWMIGAGLLVLTAVGLSSNHYLGASEGNSLLIENPTYSREAIVLKHVDQHEHTFVSTATLSTFENGDSSESISTIPADEMNDASIHAKSKNENGIPNNTQATSDVSSANDTKPENPADRLAAKTNDKSNDTDLNGSNDLGHPDAGLSIASNNIASNDNDTQSEEGETKDEVDSSDDLPDSNQDSATISNPPIVAAKYTPPTNPLTKSDYDPNFKISQSGDSGSSMSNAGINALKILDPKGEFANDLMAPEFIEPEIINLPPVDFYKPYKWAVSGSAGMYASSKLIESDYDWLNPFTDTRNTE